jgi:uncharacterized protein YcbK (DUF882 family)
MKVLSRRQFVATFAATGSAFAIGRRTYAAEAAEPRLLRFNHLHTGERLEVEYFSDGVYLRDALDSVEHLLRDFRTNELHAIDVRLLDLLHDLNAITDSRQAFQVISGYRSPITNAMLRQHSEGVAAHSLHMEGRAIDIRVADVPLTKLRDAALSMQRGGVGFYAPSNFIHVDTGRVRRW